LAGALRVSRDLGSEGRALFSTRPYRSQFHHNHDPSLADQRFLMVRNSDQDENFVVVFNWDEEVSELFR
jgi:hypothetical protein